VVKRILDRERAAYLPSGDGAAIIRSSALM